MASELERLADAVRALASPGGSVRPHVARASVQATRLSASVPGGVPSATSVTSALQAAGATLAQASALLDTFANDAERFAASLSGGGSGAGVNKAVAGESVSPSGLPEGFAMVPVSDIEDVEDVEFKMDTSPDDLAWGMRALNDVIMPGISRGMTRDDFQQQDSDLGQRGSRSYTDTYTGFFGENECMTLAPGADGKWHPENGRHRVLVARRYGFTALPCRLVGR